MDNIRRYVYAKERVKGIRIFYVHLVLFIIGIPSILALIFLIEESDQRSFWIWLILTTVITWAIGMVVHALLVFGKPRLFNKKWENRKIKEFMEEEEEVQIWE